MILEIKFSIDFGDWITGRRSGSKNDGGRGINLKATSKKELIMVEVERNGAMAIVDLQCL